MSFIEWMPSEVLLIIASSLDPKDIFNLSRTNKKYQFLNRSWKKLFFTKFPFLSKNLRHKKEQEFKDFYIGKRNEITLIIDTPLNKIYGHKLAACKCNEICRNDYVYAFLYRTCICRDSEDFMKLVYKYKPKRILQEIINNNDLTTTLLSYKSLTYEVSNNTRVLNYFRQIKSFRLKKFGFLSNDWVYITDANFIDFMSSYLLEETPKNIIERALQRGNIHYRFLEKLGARGREYTYDYFADNRKKLLYKMIYQLHLYPSQRQATYLSNIDPDYAKVLFHLPYVRKDLHFMKVIFSYDLAYMYVSFNYHHDLLTCAIINGANTSFMRLIKHPDFYYNNDSLKVLPMCLSKTRAVLFLKHLIHRKDAYDPNHNQEPFAFSSFMERSVSNSHFDLACLFLRKFYYSDHLFTIFLKKAPITHIHTVLKECHVHQIYWMWFIDYYLFHQKNEHIEYLLYYLEPNVQILDLLIKYNEPDFVKILLSRKNLCLQSSILYARELGNKNIEAILLDTNHT